jgi:hypothetical protein
MTLPHSPAFDVDPEQLRGHASKLAGYADQLSAIGGRLPDSLADQSLGSFAQFLTAGLGGAMTATLGAFADLASSVDKVSIGMRQGADSYQRTDGDSAATLTGLGEGIR